MDEPTREAPSLVNDGAWLQLQRWAAGKNLGAEMDALTMHLHCGQAVLDIPGCMEIDNPSLQALLRKLRLRVDNAKAVLDELNYFCELDSTKHAADAIPKGCLHLHSQARHTARVVAAKLKPSSSSRVTVYGEANDIDDDKLTSIDMSSARCVAQAVQTPKPKFNRVLLSTKMADIVEDLKTLCDMVSTILNLERYK